MVRSPRHPSTRIVDWYGFRVAMQSLPITDPCREVLNHGLRWISLMTQMKTIRAISAIPNLHGLGLRKDCSRTPDTNPFLHAILVDAPFQASRNHPCNQRNPQSTRIGVKKGLLPNSEHESFLTRNPCRCTIPSEPKQSVQSAQSPIYTDWG